MKHGLNKAEENQATGLAPCPFCGNQNAHLFIPTCRPETKYNPADRLYPWVRCPQCYAEAIGKNEDYKGESAIKTWNHRVQGSGQIQDSASRATRTPQNLRELQELATLNGVERIALERYRQLEVEGWTPSHDDKHEYGELALAGAWYAIPYWKRRNLGPVAFWPWDRKWYKPGERLAELIKAGALIAAEIDRLIRKGVEAALDKHRVDDVLKTKEESSAKPETLSPQTNVVSGESDFVLWRDLNHNEIVLNGDRYYNNEDKAFELFFGEEKWTSDNPRWQSPNSWQRSVLGSGTKSVAASTDDGREEKSMADPENPYHETWKKAHAIADKLDPQSVPVPHDCLQEKEKTVL